MFLETIESVSCVSHFGQGAISIHRVHRLIHGLILVFLSCSITACIGQIPADPLVTPPAISIRITKDYCPSIEVQAGMQMAWTNQDNLERSVIIERMNEQGVVLDAGGTDNLQPGDTFSTSLSELGQYTYYCSKDRTAFGTITVSAGSYPYP